VQVIYSSGSPDYNNDQEYYLHMIVVSVYSGDTVNLLTPTVLDISTDDRFKDFISSQSDMYKLIMNVNNPVEGINIDDLKVKPIEKVINNKKFPGAANNAYPSVIGTLGEVTDSTKLN
jgi:hypothetical protein